MSKYGTDNIIIMLALGILMIFAAYYISKPLVSYPLYTVGGVLIIFTLWFFRDPERNVPAEALSNPKTIISPADGHVVDIIEIEETKFLHNKAKQISIFLSPLDVHVNRIPMSGTVKYFKYTPGKYIIANHPKSSELNEQTQIGMESEYGRIFFKQIVGVVARRLVWDIKEGDNLTVGKRFGMMKFGSRMDIVISPESKILVKKGDRVRAGETIIAYLP